MKTATGYTRDYDGEFPNQGKLIRVTFTDIGGDIAEVPVDLLRELIEDIDRDAKAQVATPQQSASAHESESSPFVLGDYVSLRKWIAAKPPKRKCREVGKVIKIERGNCMSGILVTVKVGLLRRIKLDSSWLTLI